MTKPHISTQCDLVSRGTPNLRLCSAIVVMLGVPALAIPTQSSKAWSPIFVASASPMPGRSYPRGVCEWTMLRLPYVTPLLLDLLVISLLDVQMGRLPFQPPCTRKPEVVWNLSKPLTFGDWCRLASKIVLPLPVKCQRMVCNRDLFTNNDRDTCCFIQPFSASYSYTAVLLYSILYPVLNLYIYRDR